MTAAVTLVAKAEEAQMKHGAVKALVPLQHPCQIRRLRRGLGDGRNPNDGYGRRNQGGNGTTALPVTPRPVQYPAEQQSGPPVREVRHLTLSACDRSRVANALLKLLSNGRSRQSEFKPVLRGLRTLA